MRNSILDWLIAATLAFAVISGLAGIDVDLGAVSLRSHGVWRVLLAAAVLIVIRRRFGLGEPAAWVLRVALMAAIAASVLSWLRFLLTTIGGADSYGYVSASALLGSFRLIEPQPLAEALSAANRLALVSPLGWAPAADGSGIVPTYPLGVPFVMAVFSAIAGPQAVFFVGPVMGVVTLMLVYRIARDWFDEHVALLATAIAAWNPVLVAYAKQPMSDMAATMWMTLAVMLVLRATPGSGLGAGLAAAAAVLTRPVLLPAAAVIVAGANHGERGPRRLLLAGAGLAVGVAIQAGLQSYLFGSPFATGYGAAGTLFSTAHYGTNVVIFTKQAWTALGIVWLGGLIVGAQVTPPDLRRKLFAVAFAVTAPYLFWLPFDHWETLRFLLPGLVPLTVVVAAGLTRVARLIDRPVLPAVLIAAFVIPLVGRSELLLRESGVWTISEMESRYPLAGEWLNVNTPPNSVALANQHSGSLRWYGKRQTVRWDFIEPERFVQTVRELQSHGAIVYVALEGSEAEMFDQRFAGVIEQLRVDHVGRVRNVAFRRLQ